MRLNACFQQRRYSATDRKSTSNNSSCARLEEKLHYTPPAHIRNSLWRKFQTFP